MKLLLVILSGACVFFELSSKDDTTNIAIKRLTLNSEKSDFSPVLHQNKLYFVSARYHGTGVAHEQFNGSTTDIFVSDKSDSLNFKTVEGFGVPINSKFNEGPFAINKSGNEIFFSAAIKDQRLAIYYSKLENDKWTHPAVLPFCKAENNYCHPSLSADGKRIYFSSDQKNSYGGMDIFYSELVNGKWSEPKNAGNKINSKFNELFPFVCGNKQIYFASNRGEIGGLDIYAFRLQDSILNVLPPPINSKFDDFGVWVDNSTEFGFFSSNRNRKYSDDIYAFTKRFPDISELKSLPQKNSWCFTFFEETTLANDDTLNLTFEWSFGDGTKARSLMAKHCYSSVGDYTVQLNVIEKVSGEIFRSEASFPLSVINKPKAGIISSDTMPAGKPFELAAFFDLPGHEALNYYWKIGDNYFLNGEKVRHVFKHKGNYRVMLAVVARNKYTGNKEKFKIEKSLCIREKGYELK